MHRRDRRRRVVGVTVSLLGHAAITAAVALAPAFAARLRKPPEFVQVRIVPVQALGVPEPVQVEPPKPKPTVLREPAERPVEKEPPPKKEEEPRASPSPESEKRSESPVPTTPEQPSTAIQQRRGSPTGSPLGTSPFGADVGLDNPDFVYGYYIQQMLALIGNHWVRPPGAGELKLTLHFRIQSDGSLTEIELVEPSGRDSFDLAGLRAVRLASPLPPLPRSYPHDTLGVNLIIR
jgi:TonB family protein